MMIAALSSGCALVLHGSDREVEIKGPPGVTAESITNDTLPSHSESAHLFVTPPRGADSIVIRLDHERKVAHLSKRATGLIGLNILVLPWIGFLIDDASQSWYDYDPLRVQMDSTHGMNLLILDQKPAAERPKLLLLGGVGYSGQTNPLTIYGPDEFPITAVEAGVGIDLFSKKAEIFYITRVATQGVAARYFKQNLFLQFSAEWGKYDYLIYGAKDSATGTFPYQNESQSYTALGLGVGWVGDFSYVALEYLAGLKSFYAGSEGLVTISWIFIMWGLNLRI